MPLDEKQVKEVCKLGAGKETCRYLSIVSNGYKCQKLTPLAPIFNKKSEEGKVTPQGDNCEGKKEKE